MKRMKSSVLLGSEGEIPTLPSLLAECNVEVTRAVGLAETSQLAQRGAFDAVLLALPTPAPDSLFGWIREHAADAPLVVCGPREPVLERAALAAGAVQYLSWPASATEVGRALEAAMSGAGALDAPRRRASSELLGNSPHVLAVRKTVQQVATSSSTVLVRGETGTGKELVARAIHEQSPRAAAPFITVHVGALPDALLESELFGYEKGAFTGATARKAGRVELAEGGTLFFDEIGEVSPAMQVKLLRLIQAREYERLGGNRTLQADLRFVAATHRDIEHMVESGAFREDLFYRLNVVTVWMPPLRARRGDIALLVQFYFEHFKRANHKPQLALDAAAMRLLQAHRWPGNVRQLLNFLERLVVLALADVVTADDVRREMNEQITFLTQAATSNSAPAVTSDAMPSALPPDARESMPSTVELPSPADPPDFSSAIRPLREEVRRAEERALLKALHHAKGNRALAARLLGVSRRTMYTKLEEHGLL